MTNNYEYWVIDGSFNQGGGEIFSFVPVEIDRDKTTYVIGLTFLAARPPEGAKLLGVIHQDGDDAAAAYYEQYQDIIDGVDDAMTCTIASHLRVEWYNAAYEQAHAKGDSLHALTLAYLAARTAYLEHRASCEICRNEARRLNRLAEKAEVL